jgi:hypothetical protein
MIGDLVLDQRGRWITLAPTHCPVGHRLGAGQVLVGHVACMGHGGGGHTLWHCRACPSNVNPTYGPPLNLHCSVLVGPAAVRISTAKEPPQRGSERQNRLGPECRAR